MSISYEKLFKALFKVLQKIDFAESGNKMNLTRLTLTFYVFPEELYIFDAEKPFAKTRQMLVFKSPKSSLII